MQHCCVNKTFGPEHVAFVCRRLISSQVSTNRNFKSTAMLLKMSYLPELSERLVVVLDDKPEIWQSQSDRRLADMCPVRPQQYNTSDYRSEPWLKKLEQLLQLLHRRVFAQEATQMQPLPEIWHHVLADWASRMLR